MRKSSFFDQVNAFISIMYKQKLNEIKENLLQKILFLLIGFFAEKSSRLSMEITLTKILKLLLLATKKPGIEYENSIVGQRKNQYK